MTRSVGDIKGFVYIFQPNTDSFVHLTRYTFATHVWKGKSQTPFITTSLVSSEDPAQLMVYIPQGRFLGFKLMGRVGGTTEEQIVYATDYFDVGEEEYLYVPVPMLYINGLHIPSVERPVVVHAQDANKVSVVLPRVFPNVGAISSWKIEYHLESLSTTHRQLDTFVLCNGLGQPVESTDEATSVMAKSFPLNPSILEVFRSTSIPNSFQFSMVAYLSNASGRVIGASHISEIVTLTILP